MGCVKETVWWPAGAGKKRENGAREGVGLKSKLHGNSRSWPCRNSFLRAAIMALLFQGRIWAQFFFAICNTVFIAPTNKLRRYFLCIYNVILLFSSDGSRKRCFCLHSQNFFPLWNQNNAINSHCWTFQRLIIDYNVNLVTHSILCFCLSIIVFPYSFSDIFHND